MPVVSLIIVVMLASATGFSNAAIQNHPRDVPGYVYLGSIPMPSSKGKEFNENYYASASVGEWIQGEIDCRNIFGADSHLISIETQEEQDFINKWLLDRNIDGGIYWTSGQYNTETHRWYWAGTSSVIDWTNWGDNEPAIPETGISRIALHHKNESSAWWINVLNSYTYLHLCEYDSG